MHSHRCWWNKGHVSFFSSEEISARKQKCNPCMGKEMALGCMMAKLVTELVDEQDRA